MSVQAIIMAGGEGVRLRPLTLPLPKPLVPLLGEPVMGYALKLLKAHGVTDVGATLWYQPRKIKAAFGPGEAWGVKLKYYEERVPLGTAGSVGMAREHLRGTFFVLSGDGLTDCDLTQALAFHREKKALATLVLKRVNVPLPYGVVLTDQEGRVTRFIEKPTWSRVFSDLVNTGIYILEPEIFDYLPRTGKPDFGKDIFPALLSAGAALYGYETQGYWCDVGDQRAYLRAQTALLRGEVNLPHPSGVHPKAQVDGSARLEGACFLDAEAVVGPGALLRNAVIGAGCVIGAGATLENVCLWPRAVVQEKAQLTGCVLCQGAAARRGAILADGCALGEGAAAGAYSQLRPGVKVWPHLRVAPGAVAARSVASGDAAAPLWTHRGADCDSPESACALCAAFGQVTGVRQVVVAHQEAAALAAIGAGALSAAGVRVLSAGEMTPAMARCLIPALGAGGGVFARGQTLSFFDAQGESISPKQMAAMDGCLLRREAPPAFARTGAMIRFSGAEEIYLARLPGEEGGRPLWSPVGVFSDSSQLRRLALEGLGRLGGRDVRVGPVGSMELRPQETGFLLTADGEEMTVFSSGCTPSQEQKTMLLLKLCLEKNGCLFDLPGTPRAAEQLAPLRPREDSPACLWQRQVMGDGLMGMMLLCQALKGGSLEMLLRELPETHILRRDVACREGDKGRILHTLCDHTPWPHTLSEGVRIDHERGCATIVPDAYRGVVQVTSESRDSEFAKELCDFYLDEIRHMIGER